MTTLYKYAGSLIRTTGGGLAIDLDCCCCKCTCDLFNGMAPCCFTVTIAGMANGTCSSCAAYNTNYGLEQDEPGGCTWSCTFYDACDLVTDAIISLRVYKSGDNYHVEVKLKDHVWDKDFGTDAPTCTSLTGAIDHVTNSGTCSSSDATCSITPGSSHNSCGSCPTRDCGACSSGTTPHYIFVTVSLSGDHACCSGLSGLWILERTYDTPGFCYWESGFFDESCDSAVSKSASLYFTYTPGSPSNRIWFAVQTYDILPHQSGPLSITGGSWYKNTASPPINCETYLTNGGWTWSTGECDESGTISMAVA